MLLLSIMESRFDQDNAKRILKSVSPQNLIRAIQLAYKGQIDIQKTNDDFMSFEYEDVNDSTENLQANSNQNDNEEETNQIQVVGHNIFILAIQLSRHSETLASMLRNGLYPQESTDVAQNLKEALKFYSSNTAQVEVVREDGNLENIIFPIPSVCLYLTKTTKTKILNKTERDDQNSKVPDFFSKMGEMYREMLWQQTLRKQHKLFWIAKYDQMWSKMAFQIAFIINLIVAFFYPWDRIHPGEKCDISVDTSDGYQDGVCTNKGVIRHTKELVIWCFLVLKSIYSTIFDDNGDQLKRIKDLLSQICLWTVLWQILVAYKKNQVMILLGIINLIIKIIYLISFVSNRGLLESRQILTNKEFLWHSALLLLSILGMSCEKCVFFYSFLLLDLIFREETLANVMSSVTVNSRSIVLTTMLMFILVYMFSIIGFLSFQKHFEIRLEDDDETTDEIEGHCSTLLMCIVTTLNNGLRSGGGIGDVLAPVSIWSDSFYPRVVYDLLFFFVLIIIVLNLIFGVIIDTFGALREEKEQDEEILKNSCFICGLRRQDFDQLNNKTLNLEAEKNNEVKNEISHRDEVGNSLLRQVYDSPSSRHGISHNSSHSKTHHAEELTFTSCNPDGILSSISNRQAPSFDHHIHHEHNMWHYVYFITYMKIKESTEFTGPESYVSGLIQTGSCEWFPKGKAISLQLFAESLSENDPKDGVDSSNFNASTGGGNEIKGLSKRIVEELRQKLDSNVDAIEHLAQALKSVQTLVNDQLKKEQIRKREEQLNKRIGARQMSNTHIRSQTDLFGNTNFGYNGMNHGMSMMYPPPGMNTGMYNYNGPPMSGYGGPNPNYFSAGHMNNQFSSHPPPVINKSMYWRNIFLV